MLVIGIVGIIGAVIGWRVKKYYDKRKLMKD
jgi:type II secretory pathway pseudopilin PulG